MLGPIFHWLPRGAFKPSKSVTFFCAKGFSWPQYIAVLSNERSTPHQSLRRPQLHSRLPGYRSTSGCANWTTGYGRAFPLKKLSNSMAVSEIKSWETESVWPGGAGWRPEKDVVLQNVQNLLNEWEATLRSGADAAVLVVSSNGFFRLLAERMGVPPRDRKMATGHISIVSLVVPEHRWRARCPERVTVFALAKL